MLGEKFPFMDEEGNLHLPNLDKSSNVADSILRELTASEINYVKGVSLFAFPFLLIGLFMSLSGVSLGDFLPWYFGVLSDYSISSSFLSCSP